MERRWQHGKTKKRRWDEMHPAEHKHGAGAAGEVDEILPARGAVNLLGDPQSIG